MTYAQHLAAARKRLGFVRCVAAPVGPPVVVKVPSGPVIHGYRVPDGYERSGVHEVIYEGQAVNTRWEPIPGSEEYRLVLRATKPPEFP